MLIYKENNLHNIFASYKGITQVMNDKFWSGPDNIQYKQCLSLIFAPISAIETDKNIKN